VTILTGATDKLTVALDTDLSGACAPASAHPSNEWMQKAVNTALFARRRFASSRTVAHAAGAQKNANHALQTEYIIEAAKLQPVGAHYAWGLTIGLVVAVVLLWCFFAVTERLSRRQNEEHSVQADFDVALNVSPEIGNG